MTRRRLLVLLRSPRDLALVLRMTAWALALPVLKFALPLPRLVRLLASNRATRARQRQREARTSELARLLYRSRRPGFADNCLERSLVTYRYLGRLGAEPSLVVAVGTERDNVVGHVWVAVDGKPVHETTDFVAQYVPVAAFGPNGEMTEVKQS